MHIDEDFAQLAVFIFAGAQIHLMAADGSLLGISLAPVGQASAPGHEPFDDPFGDDFRLGGGGLFGDLVSHLQVLVVE